MTWKSKRKADRRVIYMQNELWECEYICGGAKSYFKRQSSRARRKADRELVEEELGMLDDTWEVPYGKKTVSKTDGDASWIIAYRRWRSKPHRVRQSYPTTSWRSQLYYERRARNMSPLRRDDE